MTTNLQYCQEKHNLQATRPCTQCRKRSQAKNPKTFIGPNSRGRVLASRQDYTVKGTRSLKKPDLQMHERMSEMDVRMHQLENAIAQLQKSVSSQPHPLLVPDVQIYTASTVPTVQRSSNDENPFRSHQALDADAELARAFGVMSIFNDGTQYHGETASSEYLLKACEEKEEGRDFPTDFPAKRPQLDIYPDLVLFNVQFPSPPADQAPPDMKRFLPFLPPHDRALTLLDNYYSYFGWLAMPIPKSDIDKIFTAFYPEGTKIAVLDLSSAHNLALLFMVFLLGTLYDLSLDYSSLSAKAEEFQALARAAMAADPVMEHTTLQGIQVFIILIWYFRMFPGRISSSYQWVLSGYLTKLVQSIGLHRDCRDSSRYIPDLIGRDGYEQTFWEYHGLDIWQSYMFGRPISMTSSVVHCKLPSKVDIPQGHDPEFFIWKYSFAHLVADVVGETTVKTVRYADIIKNEKRFKAHPVPLGLAWPPRDLPLCIDETVGKTFQRGIVAVSKQLSIMYLHRKYFWETISENPNDPAKSPYWYSVVAAYDSATALIADVRRLWLTHPRLIERMGPFWSHTQSAAVVLGALVAVSPGCEFAKNALHCFDETYQMFLKAKDSFQPFNGQLAMLKVQRKAHSAFKRFHNLPDETGKGGDHGVFTLLAETAPAFTLEDFESRPAGVYTGSSTSSEDSISAQSTAAGFTVPSLNHAQHKLAASLSNGTFAGETEGFDMELPEAGCDQLMSQVGMHY